MEALKRELKQRIIEALNLQDVTAGQIQDDAPLFGGGLGLDSIDALELIVLVEKHYGIRITDMKVGKQAFASINSLAAFIREKQPPCGNPR